METLIPPPPKLIPWASSEASGHIIDKRLYPDPSYDAWILDKEITPSSCKVGYYIEAPPTTKTTNVYFGIFNTKTEKLFITAAMNIPNNPDATRFYSASVELDFKTSQFKFGEQEICKLEPSNFYVFCVISKKYDVSKFFEASLKD